MHDWRIDVAARLAGLNLTPTREAEILDEWSQHLAEREAALVRRGVSADEARRLTHAELEGADLVTPDLDRAPLPADLVALGAPRRWRASQIWQDVRYAARALRRDRGYSLPAAIALAIGIGTTAAIVGAVDAVLIRPMPFPHADRLFVPVSVHLGRGILEGSTTFADYTDWRKEVDLFEAVALWRPVAVDVTGGGDPERVEAYQVSEEYFRLIDVAPVAGRTFAPGDHVAGAARVAVLSHRLWQRRFGGASVIGTRITISGNPHDVVGVLPPRVVWPDTSDLYLPLRPAQFNEDVRTRRDNMIFNTLARLKEGVPVERADARLAAMAAHLERADPVIRKGWTNRLVPLREFIVEADVRQSLWVLLGAVVAVLLIVCANVANLALVRGQARSRELAIRLALGASRGRIVQQLVIETGVLAAFGALLGAFVTYGVMRGLVLMAPTGTPFVEAIRIDARVLAVTAIVSLVALIVAGLAPALASSALRVGMALKDGTAGSGSSRRVMRLRHLLVIGEIAAAVVLLVVASLLVRSFTKLTGVESGVDVDRVLTGRVSLPGARYPDVPRATKFFSDLVERLEARPDVEAAAAASFVPAGTGGFGLGRVFLAEGRPEPPAGADVPGQWNSITPGYLRTVGIPVVTGRAFTDHDGAGATPVIIVTDSFARRMFPGENPLGRRIRSWRDENVLREIVGVVADVKYTGLADKETPLVYVPYAQDTWGSMIVVVRVRSGDPARLEPGLRTVITALDNQLAVARVATMASAARASIAAQRYAAVLVGLLAAVALLLAALGIYGVMSYVFAFRRRELGIRVALGAPRRSLYALVYRYGVVMTTLGLALGVAGAIAAARLLETLLFDTRPSDWLAWSAMIGTIVLAAALACIGPARRSARTDPIIALRGE
jgi:putative ABC transport system permease protein